MPKSKEFLTSSDDDNSDSDAQPKPKKKKQEAKPAKQAKPEKAEKSGGPSRGAGGEYMIDLSKMKYATVSEFRGKLYVGIREYYEKDGELRPGRKGVSLNTEQWQALKDNIAEVDECLRKF